MGKVVSNKKKLANAKQKSKPTSAAGLNKQSFVEKIRQCIDAHEFLFVFDLVNSRTSLLKQVRDQFKSEGTFIFGKSKLMQIALGRTKQEEYKKGLSTVSAQLARANLKGNTTVGLFFTNHEEMQEKLDECSRGLEKDYARSGFVCPANVELKSGPILGLPSSMLDQLRDLKLPVKLNKGVIELTDDFMVCTESEPCTVESARVLKLFGIRLSEFKIRLLWRWSKSGQVTKLLEDVEEAVAEEGDVSMEEEEE